MSKQIAKPSLLDLLQELRLDIFNSFNCHRIGKISKFDSSNQTAEVELVDKAVIPTSKGNLLKDFPLLTDCPVFVNKGINGGFTRPIEKGEYCIVAFNDRDIENWFNVGGINKTASSRTHNLTDGLVFTGFFSNSSPLGNYNNNATEMNFQGTKISLDGKVGVSNASQSLKTLIEQLIDAIDDLMVVDPISGELPTSAGTSADLAQVKTDFNALLKT